MKPHPRRWRRWLGLLFLVGALPGATLAEGSEGLRGPEFVPVDGVRLARVGEGVREVLFVDLYAVTHYLPGDAPSAARSGARGLRRAFRVEVLYEDSKPEKIPETWREELFPLLEPEQERALRRAYDRTRAGDVYLIRYVPEAGTEIVRNGRSVLTDAGPRLMDAFIDLWLGDHPVSDDLKRALLGQ